jgi:cell division protein ZapA (FtsZ GTPase activity inhibitor)
METGSKEKRSVRVTIANQSFSLVTTGDDREVLDLANRVDELISGIAARSSHTDGARLAILACLHLADRNHAIEKELRELRERMQSHARQVADLLDRVNDIELPAASSAPSE